MDSTSRIRKRDWIKLGKKRKN